jgi:protease-4
LKLNLSGAIKYQKYIFFDDSQTLSRILFDIDKATKDKSIKGIVINATGLASNREILWEIREKLREFKLSGKQVIMFLERGGISDYHFASIADKIIIDPQGMISLEGYILSRSFYKNMLDKLGIGFEELRYFKYKSAAESYAREKMSDADREQRQKLVDDWYEITKREVCESRKFTPEQFDSLVTGEMAYVPTLAIEKKLVDTVGRWVDVDKIVQSWDKSAGFTSNRGLENDFKPFDDRWSDSRKKIAIIYAIGACAMESGIKARTLVNDVKAAMEDSSIKAVVLRVDSPGGDAMASDYIAEVLRNNTKNKPIIISQGSVAASGGYWLSMDGHVIVASPMTITGSIGVIASWMYDKGAAKDLGITTDYVKSGKYADMGNSFLLPIIPIGLPVRNLNEDERGFFQKSITSMYKDFVGKVAKGRKMKYEEIENVAQGRVWSGLDGKKNGLVDELGGMWKAIEIAADRAGLNMSKDDIQFVELPKREAFDFSALFGGMFSIDIKSTVDRYNDLKFRMENVRTPLLVMPLDYYDIIPRF